MVAVVAATAIATAIAAACTPPTPTPAAIRVTAPSATISYGDPIPAVTPSYTNLPSGQTETTTPATCSTTAATGSPAGTYPAICSGAAQSGRTISYVSGTITIEPKAATVTASSGSMAFGGSVPAITAAYDGLTNGDTEPDVLATCTTTATSTSNAGTYPSSCSGAADPNYTFTYVDGTVDVGTAPVVVTASSATSTYGDAAPAIGATYSGLLNGDTEPATPPTCTSGATAGSPVGAYASTCSGAADPNYTFTYVDGSVSVTPAPAVVTASSQTVAFGATLAPVTPSYSGLANGDTTPATPPACSTNATAGSPVGAYPTTCAGAADPNYTFTYVAGTVTISAGSVPVTVTASSATITYGEAVPVITPSYAGFTGGQTQPATGPTCTTTATAGSPVGTYPTTCTGAADPNFTFDEVSGTITITPAAATVTASSDTATYGGTVPAITASYSGLVNGDTVPATLPTCSTTATSASPVGSYPSACLGASDPNYTFAAVAGSVSVTKAPLVVTASDGSMTFGGTVPAITGSIAGFVNGDTAVATAPTCSTTATSASPAGTYPSTCSGADDPNYSFTYVAGTVTVAPAALPTLTITASSPSVQLGAAPVVTPTYSGLVGGDTAPATPPTCTSTADASSPIGRYPTTCAGAADPDYDIVYVAGIATVSPSDGFALYAASAKTTTIAAASNGASLGSNVNLTVASASGAGFATYQNLTVQTTNNGAQAYFCKSRNTTVFSTCTANGASGTVATGGFVSAAPMNRFDVYTVSGGKAAVSPTSLTILADVAVAGRGMPSRATADANNGIVTYVQSAAPSGTLELTYGICRAGTASYSAADPTCSTGVIRYGAGVDSHLGDAVTVSIVTSNIYQDIGTAISAPSSVAPGSTHTAYIAPAPSAIPKLQDSGTFLGDATVNSSSRFTSIYPIPQGMTYQSARLIGGDATTAGTATVNYCTALAQAAPCDAKAASGTYVHNATPYLIVTLPSGNVPGGRQSTMPTIEVRLTATGSSGTVGQHRLTQIVNVTSASLAGNTTATFEGYPTTGSNSSITPPVAAPVILKTTTIS